MTETKNLDRGRAESLFDQLRAVASSGENYDETDDLEPKVKTGDNRHYFVGFTLKGRAIGLFPEDARSFAFDLIKAADEADEKMTDDALQELYADD